MGRTVETEDKTLKVNLFDDGMVEIESSVYKKVAIEVKTIDPTVDVTQPKGSLYRICTYVPGDNVKSHPSEYDIAWVMSDGTILHRKDRRSKGL